MRSNLEELDSRNSTVKRVQDLAAGLSRQKSRLLWSLLPFSGSDRGRVEYKRKVEGRKRQKRQMHQVKGTREAHERRTGQFAAYNPLTGALDLVPPTPDEFFDDGHGLTSHLDCFILASEEGDGPFRLVTICHDESRARAAVFSSDSREWRIFPWSEAVEPLPEDEHWLKVGTMVNGFIYWIQANEAGLLVLNTATLHFSRMDLPPFLEGKIHLVWPGEAKDGRLCIVCPVDFGIHVWFWRADEDGFERWMLEKKFQLELKSIVEATGGSLEDVELHIVDTIDGFVYFSTGETFHNVHVPSWFLSLCMETAKLDMLFQKRCDSHVRPCIMPWPPSLVNNKLCPLLEGEGA
ncbi:unnamed protein product [Triticum turgidum subsp. durum]|uniref:F-box protein AT5G49610-like beta-propeller domain-containing protein n=1 Tax=Triticum turgidum subsp. durum TaxID=4567 RepID=A0A9R0XWH0_TRITD|nr:unnamed protein product [Triticum turgidum subsp. durum]